MARSHEALAASLQQILGQLRSDGFPFLQLRHREFDGSMYEGDYDFLIDERWHSNFVRRITELLADQRQFFLLQTTLHPYSRKYTIRIWDTSVAKFVTLEFWREFIFQHAGFPAAIRWQDLEYAITATSRGFELREEIAALLLLAHLSTKSKPLDVPLVAERLRLHRQGLAGKPGSLARDVLELVERVADRQLDTRKAGKYAVTLLSRSGRIRPTNALLRLQARRWLADYPRMAIRGITAHTAAVVGPDGSGKSTLVSTLTERAPQRSVQARVFKRFFRDRLIYKLLVRTRAGQGREQRNVWDERVGGWLALLSLPAYLTTLLRARRRILVLDRYFYDFLMVDVRDPKGEPRPKRPPRSNLLFLVPQPHLVLNPLAEHESTVNRRDALTQTGFLQYQRQLLDMIARRPPSWFAHIPAGDLDQSTTFALRAVERSRLRGWKSERTAECHTAAVCQ